MAKRVNWYFDGWTHEQTLTPGGRKKTRWSYHGVYYSYGLDARRLRRLKRAHIAAALLETALWFVMCLPKTAGRDAAFYVGGFWYLCILPLMALLIGAWGMRGVSEKMTYRDVCAGDRNLRRGAWALLALQCASVAGALVFLAVYWSGLDPVRELFWLAGALLCALVTAAHLALLRRVRPMQLPQEKTDI